MAKLNNKAWQLEDFIDSLVFELDKARETLSLKGVNSPLTYAVKDLSMDLNVFPVYDGTDVRFVTAGSGESGSSKISLSLGSITDRQIRETAKKPVSQDDITLDELEDLDETTKKQLNRMGVRSAEDVKNLNDRNIKTTKVVTQDEEGTSSGPIDFKKLAGLINKAQRTKKPPRVVAAQMGVIGGRTVLSIKGENLALEQSAELKAKLNNVQAKILGANQDQILIELSDVPTEVVNQLTVQLDEHTEFNIAVRQPKTNSSE